MRSKLASWKANCLSLAGSLGQIGDDIHSALHHASAHFSSPYMHQNRSDQPWLSLGVIRWLEEASSPQLQNNDPREVVNRIKAVPLPISTMTCDGMTWRLTASGQFTPASAYKHIQGVSNPLTNFNPSTLSNHNLNWNWIWKLSSAEKIKSFIWLIMHNGIYTNSERKRRHLSDSFTCPGCNQEEETWIHMLRDCDYAREVWKELQQPPDFYLQEKRS